MKEIKISVIKDFHPRPYGRTIDPDGAGSGESFKIFLEEKIKRLQDDEFLTIDLSGFNRYDRSFIDEAFGGLIRSKSITPEKFNSKVKYKHKELPSIEALIKERIKSAIESLK
ncbi:STAS-like domain-containing protein [Pseudomonas leptonychotis]|uniref:STAS-like domain-containing protein n=1 Tax=Pseudomonas leptonychotis TaxID=2448482 RepID=UPI00386DECAA